MALMPCSECGKEISSLATACPHCGAPAKHTHVVQGTRPTTARITSPAGNSALLKMVLTFAALIAGLFLVMFIIAVIEESNDPQSAERYRGRQAIKVCREQFEQKAADPVARSSYASACARLESDFKTKFGRDP